MSNDFLADLGRELDRAAADVARGRQPRRRAISAARLGRARSAVKFAAVSALAAAAIGLAVGSLQPDEREASAPGEAKRGIVGGKPTFPYGDRPAEGGSYDVPPTLLAVGERDWWRFEVVGLVQRLQKERPELCIDVVIGARAYGCGSFSEHIDFQAFGREESLVAGATTKAVDRIEVSFRISGKPGTAEGVLAHANNRDALRRLGIPQPFTYYVARIPGRPTDVIATAYDHRGAEVWQSPAPLP